MNSLQINQSWLNYFFQSQHFLYKGMWGGRGVNKFIFKYIPDVLLETINIKNYFFHPTPSVNFGNWRRHFCSFVWPSNLVMYLLRFSEVVEWTSKHEAICSVYIDCAWYLFARRSTHLQLAAWRLTSHRHSSLPAHPMLPSKSGMLFSNTVHTTSGVTVGS